MDNKKPITLNNLEEWDFTDLSLIRTEQLGTKYHHIIEPAMKVGSSESYMDSLEVNMDSLEVNMDSSEERKVGSSENGTIEYLYPGVPNHPKQKYKATNKKL